MGVPSGGRGPAEQVTLLPWGDERVPAADPAAPWPGRLPAPAPATVPPEPLVVDLVDAAGLPVEVTGRAEVSGEPVAARYDGRLRPVLAWAGPWPVDERWWDPAEAHRAVRAQVLLGESGPGGSGPGEAGTGERLALLLRCSQGRWQLEGVYD